MIAPSVIKFETDHFICGNTYRCVWALREYPTATGEQAILSCLGEKDGVTLCIYTCHVTPVEERKIICNAANKNRMDRGSTNDSSVVRSGVIPLIYRFSFDNDSTNLFASVHSGFNSLSNQNRQPE